MSNVERLTLVTALEEQSAKQWRVAPVHMKLLPWFHTENVDKVAAAIDDVTDTHRPLTAIGEGVTLLGEIPNAARLIGDYATLRAFHDDLHDAVAPHVTFEKPHFVSNGYLPHVSVQPHGIRGIRRGEAFHIEELQLAQSTPEAITIRRRYRLQEPHETTA